MRVTNLELLPPRCLLAVRPSKPEPELYERMVKAFVSDAEDAKALARHESRGNTDPWMSTREELKAWNLACPCGADQAKLFGVRKDDQFNAPVRFECMTCSESTIVFDASADGWNAEIAKRKRAKPRKEPKTTFAMHCRKCKNTVWRPAAIVTYQADNFFDIPEDRIKDYFDMIALGGCCATCGDVAFGFDVECT